MRRRSFLKLIGLATAAVGLPLSASAATSPRTRSAVALSGAPSQRLYRARGGRIYVSSNAGRSWMLHTYLGPEFDITRVKTDGAGGAELTVAYGGRTFDLTLAQDLRSWLTA